MQDLEKIKAALINQKIKAIYHTPKGEGEELIPGLGNFYTFDTIIALENGKQYRLGDAFIVEWLGNVELLEITPENWNIPDVYNFKSISIKELLITTNKSYYLLLENEVLINHTSEMGDALHFRSYSSVFNNSGELLAH